MRLSTLSRPRHSLITLTVVVAVVVLVYAKWFLTDPFQIHVFIVEEHHEVLPYWIEAAQRGLIPRQGNTLVHVDGHGDEATPVYLPEMAFFRFPETDDEIGLLLQKNDIFIQAAVITGLVDHVIWIFPSWDPTIQAENGEYAKRTVELGWTKVKVGDEIIPHFCECLLMEDGARQCQVLNTTSSKEAEEELDPKLCTVEKTYTSEHILEDAASHVLEDNTFREHRSIILDFDEDYFGCENAAMPLTDAGIQWKQVEQLDSVLRKLLCPFVPHQEDMSDEIMKNLLVFYQRLCKWETGPQERCITPIKHLFVETKDKVVHFWRKHPSLFCARNDLEVRNKWRDVLRILFTLTRSQLQAVMKMGFCFRTARISLGFNEEEGELRLCHGNNPPHDPVVFLHTPDQTETDKRFKKLTTILASDALANPKLVTVARSVRDGYTPRNEAAKLEKLMLDALIKSHTPGTFQIIYDPNLLGGDEGWSSRDRHRLH